jgi:uncharacterized membrane protein
VAWSAASAAGLYIHYFTLFAFIAQAIVPCVLVVRRSESAAAFRSLGITVAVTAVAFLPWIPTLVAQQGSPEQRWLTFAIYGSSPLQVPYKIASAWQTMLLGKAWDLGATGLRHHAGSRAGSLSVRRRGHRLGAREGHRRCHPTTGARECCSRLLL